MADVALASESVPGNVTALVERVLREMPTHRSFLRSALDQLTKAELTHLSEYLDFGQAQGRDLDALAESYCTVVEDTLREQRYFLRHGRYRHRTFAEVAGSVYFDDDYMGRYMTGLVLTAFFWPNHVAMARWFAEVLPTDRRGRYLEIGPGHGYHLLFALRTARFDDYLGIDLSATSVAQTRAVVDHFAPERSGRVRLVQEDFLASRELPEGSFDAIVMGEVLEHVERPEAFLERMRALARKDAFLYVTTCLNAPAVDHIYLWRTPEALEGMVEACGLAIVDALRLPYEGKTLAESVDASLAINVAYVLAVA